MPRRALRRGRGFRPATFWAGDIPIIQTVVPAASKVILSSFTNASGEELTIRRTRGLFTVSSDQSAASEFVIGAMGALAVTNTALTAGVASLPDPFTDVDDDVWYVFEHFAQTLQVFTAVGVEPRFVTHYAFDSKAMRKVPDGEGIAFVAANAAAANGCTMSLSVRWLSSITGA